MKKGNLILKSETTKDSCRLRPLLFKRIIAVAGIFLLLFTLHIPVDVYAFSDSTVSVADPTGWQLKTPSMFLDERTSSIEAMESSIPLAVKEWDFFEYSINNYVPGSYGNSYQHIARYYINPTKVAGTYFDLSGVSPYVKHTGGSFGMNDIYIVRYTTNTTGVDNPDWLTAKLKDIFGSSYSNGGLAVTFYNATKDDTSSTANRFLFYHENTPTYRYDKEVTYYRQQQFYSTFDVKDHLGVSIENVTPAGDPNYPCDYHLPATPSGAELWVRNPHSDRSLIWWIRNDNDTYLTNVLVQEFNLDSEEPISSTVYTLGIEQEPILMSAPPNRVIRIVKYSGAGACITANGMHQYISDNFTQEPVPEMYNIKVLEPYNYQKTIYKWVTVVARLTYPSSEQPNLYIDSDIISSEQHTMYLIGRTDISDDGTNKVIEYEWRMPVNLGMNRLEVYRTSLEGKKRVQFYVERVPPYDSMGTGIDDYTGETITEDTTGIPEHLIYRDGDLYPGIPDGNQGLFDGILDGNPASWLTMFQSSFVSLQYIIVGFTAMMGVIFTGLPPIFMAVLIFSIGLTVVLFVLRLLRG